MNKGLLWGYLGTLPLTFLLKIIFGGLESAGILHTSSNNSAFIIGIYIVVLIVYSIFVYLYLKRQSTKNLEKLKKGVEEVTGKKLS